MELRRCMSDVTRAKEDHSKGRLTDDAYLEVVVSRATQSLGGMAGRAKRVIGRERGK
jgi:hypothetical protein